MQNNSVQSCPVTTALSIIGGKWKVIILYHLQEDKKRFGELQRLVKGISQKMLTQELRDLEETGLVARKVYPVVPPKVEYSLTDLGRSLRPVLDQLCEWGENYRKLHAKDGAETNGAALNGSAGASRELASAPM